MSASWMNTAPRRTGLVIEPCVISSDDEQRDYPALAFAFTLAGTDEEPITVLLVMDPADLLNVSRTLQSAVHAARKSARTKNEHRQIVAAENQTEEEIDG